MALRYNSDTDSVCYLTHADVNSVQEPRSYGTSSALNWTRRTLSNVPWERVLILLVVNISIISFIFSAVNFIECHRLIEETSKQKSSNLIPPPALLLSSATYAPFAELQVGSGDDENGTEAHWTPQSIREMIKVDSQDTKKWMARVLNDKLTTYTRWFESQEAATIRVSNSLQQFRGLTKSEISSVKDQLDEILQKQNDIWKYQNDNKEPKETSLFEIMKILKKVIDELEDVRDRLTRMHAVFSNVSTQNQSEFSTKHLEFLRAMNETVHEVGMHLSDLEANTTIQRQQIFRELQLISGKANRNHVAILHQTYALSEQLSLALEVKRNLSNVRLNANTKIQRIENTMQQRLNSMSRQCSTKIFQTESRLNAAVQKVKQDIVSSVRKLSTATATANKLKTYQSFMENVNSSLASLSAALEGKADKDWTPAPNGYEYHLTPQLFTSWVDAKAKCQQLGASLACVGPRNTNMQKYLFANLVGPRGESAWIGLSDRVREGTWKWIDGISLDVTNWSAGQPNNIRRYDADQDCAEIHEKDGLWNDHWCVRQDGGSNVALCERRI